MGEYQRDAVDAQHGPNQPVWPLVRDRLLRLFVLMFNIAGHKVPKLFHVIWCPKEGFQ